MYVCDEDSSTYYGISTVAKVEQCDAHIRHLIAYKRFIEHIYTLGTFVNCLRNTDEEACGAATAATATMNNRSSNGPRENTGSCRKGKA